MKLNYKRTIFVGFAFLLICMFWQAYDNIIPKILTDKFGMSQTWSGFIMALDNVFAVFLLPLFGALSDRKNSKMGRRTPFILIGTLCAALLFVGLSFTDNMQLTAIDDITAVTAEASEEHTLAMEKLYDSGVVIEAIGSDGEKVKAPISDFFSKDEFISIQVTKEDGKINEVYNDYVVPARQAYAWQMTLENPVTLIVFIVILLGVLLSMATFRSPAVALMPDVTPKPLRSKANAIINLMGSIGGVLVLVLGIVFATGSAGNALMSYTTFFMTISILMLVSLIIFMLTVKEPKWAAEARALDPDEGVEIEKAEAKKSSLSRGEKFSLIFILASVVLWYMGYNAVTSKYSVYAGNVLNMDFNTTLIIAQAAAIISYIPVGIISSKLGRKRTIIAGVIMLGTAFGAAAFLTSESNIWVMNALFALAGIGWATINVNSYPMVVELAKSGDVGKYTGYYYTASMAAQIVTPVLSGLFLDHIGMRTLFPYATIFALGALFTMLAVRHGDSIPAPKRDLLENLDVD